MTEENEGRTRQMANNSPACRKGAIPRITSSSPHTFTSVAVGKPKHLVEVFGLSRSARVVWLQRQFETNPPTVFLSVRVAC